MSSSSGKNWRHWSFNRKYLLTSTGGHPDFCGDFARGTFDRSKEFTIFNKDNGQFHAKVSFKVFFSFPGRHENSTFGLGQKSTVAEKL